MFIRRTANAGVELTLSGTKVLLDGVSPAYGPYLGTPENIRRTLLQEPADALAFTHHHPDHYDREFAEAFAAQTHRPILEPVGQVFQLGQLTVTAEESRHIGAAGKNTPHVSYFIEGDRQVWFLGDASPLQFRDRQMPDVLIVPFAYAATPAAWNMAKHARHVILLHMPRKDQDEFGIWAAVEKTTAGAENLYIPEMGEGYNL